MRLGKHSFHTNLLLSSMESGSSRAILGAVIILLPWPWGDWLP
jgi:hypothetical protein